jgi:hypothetical protein
VRQLHAGAQWHLHEVQHLRRHERVQLMGNYSFKADPRINDWTREQLREFCSSLEGNVVQLANRLGLKVLKEEEEFFPYERGYLAREPQHGSASGWIIRINGRDRAEVQNFTVAHEIGHFVLHGARLDKLDIFDGRLRRNTDDAQDPFSYIEASDKFMESEANQFATELLMPMNQFRPAYERLGRNISALADLFFVSERVVERRLRELGLK